MSIGGTRWTLRDCVPLEGVGRGVALGSAEAAREPLALPKGGTVGDRRRLTQGGGRRLGEVEKGREDREEGDERETWNRRGTKEEQQGVEARKKKSTAAIRSHSLRGGLSMFS
jgi:hypothetical protein